MNCVLQLIVLYCQVILLICNVKIVLIMSHKLCIYFVNESSIFASLVEL